MTYIYNPKMNGSNVLGCVPLHGPCPFACHDCFAQDRNKKGRSYLGENWEDTPNMPSAEQAEGKIIRVNDIGDSSAHIDDVIAAVQHYRHRFYNTSFTKFLQRFDAPVVLTANPGREAHKTDTDFNAIEDPTCALMAVRVRANTWNMPNVQNAVDYYTANGIPVIITFMAYYESEIPAIHKHFYVDKQRIINNYNCITQKGWDHILAFLKLNDLVYTCGADAATHACAECRNCEKLYVRHMLRKKPTHELNWEEIGELLDLLRPEDQDEMLDECVIDVSKYLPNIGGNNERH